MPIVRCPYCASEAEVESIDIGHQVACPSCTRAYTARETGRPEIVERGRQPEPERPRQRDFDDRDDYRERPSRRRRHEDDRVELEEDVRLAKAKVFMPALFASIFSLIWLAWQVLDAVLVILMPQLIQQQNNPFMPKGGAQFDQASYLAIKAFVILWQLVTIGGSFAMMRLGSHGFAKAAMIMLLVPICSSCCILGIPFGIWGLIVLHDETVVRGYHAKEMLERG